jgi:hypothetical protein
MLTESQENYLNKIPEDSIAEIKAWNPDASNFAKKLIEQIKQDSGLEIFWCGSLAMGISGQNDIDLYIFAEPKNFELHLPEIIKSLGKPTYILNEKILWRIIKNSYKIDASLLSKNSKEVKHDLFFTESLKSNQDLLQEYILLKNPGLSAREYYRLKNEFYNRVVGNQ